MIVSPRSPRPTCDSTAQIARARDGVGLEYHTTRTKTILTVCLLTIAAPYTAARRGERGERDRKATRTRATTYALSFRAIANRLVDRVHVQLSLIHI